MYNKWGCIGTMLLLSFLWSNIVLTQNVEEASDINIIYGGNFIKNEVKYPGASIFSNDGKQVRFKHEGVDVWCDFAVYYQQANTIKASGEILLKQGDTITMTSKYIEYDGNRSMAISKEEVVLKTNKFTLLTDTLFFDRKIQEAYYNNHGKLKDSLNTLTSVYGKYYMKTGKVSFKEDVEVVNKDVNVVSTNLFYFPKSKNIYFYGPTTITGNTHVTYGERGFYRSGNKTGYLLEHPKIDYDEKIIYGDSIYFDDARKFASLTNNVKIIDTINDGMIRGHYAELYRDQDSIIMTKRPEVINVQKRDSLYMHGDTLLLTGPEKYRQLRLYHKVRIYKKGMSGKSDSLHSSERSGYMKMLGAPVFWNGETQLTGDTIIMVSNLKTEKLDSLKVLERAFVIDKDTLRDDAYNQIKSKDIFGLFEDNELCNIHVVKNAELLNYLYNKKKELMGINKTICGRMEVLMDNKKMEEFTFFEKPVGDIFPEKDLPENARKLKGFDWRADEIIRSKEDLFEQDDKDIVLPEIKGFSRGDIDKIEYLQKTHIEPSP